MADAAVQNDPGRDPGCAGIRRVAGARRAGGVDSAALDSTANAALTTRKAVTTARAPSAESPTGRCQVAVPISVRSRVGAVAVEVEGAKESELEPVIDLLRLGACWLEALLDHEAASAQLVMALELVEIALEHGRFQAGATAVATELATRLGCERVSIGMMRKAGIRVEALSHSAHFDARVQLIRTLAGAMDEAADQIRTEMTDAADEAAREQEIIVSSAEGAMIAASLAWLALLLRGGSLAALAFSSLPLWRGVDPLAVLALSDEERKRIEEDNRKAREQEDEKEKAVGRLFDDR